MKEKSKSKCVIGRVALTLAMVMLAAHCVQGVTIGISADAANSTEAGIGYIANLVNDSFAYDAVTPTATSPVRVWNSNAGYHALVANNTDVTLSFMLDAPYTQSGTDLYPVIDMWGRSDCCQVRDDNIDIYLYNGDYSNVVTMAIGVSIPDGDPQHLRVVFDNLFEGEVFDRFQIIGHDMDSPNNNPFTLMEIRLAVATPFNYLWTGDAGDGNWTNTVNWLGEQVPIDNLDGTGNNAGLTLLRSKSIGFGGDHLPSTNFPGIGGTTGIGDSPTMIFNSGGTGVFNVVSRERGIWTESVGGVCRIFEVGDGIGGGLEDVTVRVTGLTGTINRHAGGRTHDYLVNSDGTLVFENNVDFTYAGATDRFSTMTINDGDIIVNGVVYDLKRLTQNHVEFTSTGGTFTASYGGDFGNNAAARTRLGIDFISPDENVHFKLIDNAGASFTVTPGEYRWTGEANDGDWNNMTNWAGGVIPVDGDSGSAGLNVPYNEFIVFDGTNLPSLNVPGIGGWHPDNGKDSPSMVFKRGGAISLNVVSSDRGFWTANSATRSVLTVGDGIGGGAEDVNITVTGLTGSLNRHNAGSTHNFLVKSDGVLTFAGNVDFTLTSNTDRFATFTIDGGDVIINGSVTDLKRIARNYVEFNDLDGTFSAQYGGEFNDLAAVESSIGVDFIDNVSPEGIRLAAVNNGSTFTVKYELIPPPGTLLLLQ